MRRQRCVVICYDDIFAIFFVSIFLFHAREICTSTRQQAVPLNFVMHFGKCHFIQKTNCCSSSSSSSDIAVNDVDLLDVKRRRTPFSIRSNVLRKYFLRCTALVVRIDIGTGRVWVVVVVVAQPPISCCEWRRKNPENLYLLVGSILALWRRWRRRRRRRSFVCLHFSHPISTSSYGNVHTAHTYFDWFRRTLKQSVSSGRSAAFCGVVRCMRRRQYTEVELVHWFVCREWQSSTATNARQPVM